MKTITVTMDEPPSANRWWRSAVKKTRKGFRCITYLSEDAREYKAKAALAGSDYMMRGPVALKIDWYRGRKAGDLDKRIGILFDALQGVFYDNDSEIVDFHARRFDDPGNARIVVTVTQLEEELPL